MDLDPQIGGTAPHLSKSRTKQLNCVTLSKILLRHDFVIFT